MDKIMPNRNSPMREDEMEIIEEIVMHQRLQNIHNTDDVKNKQAGKTPLPAELLRRYEVIIVPGPGSKTNLTPLRGLKAGDIGSIVSIKAIVVRNTDVKPFIRVACYACDVCGHEVYQVINSRTYMPLVDCPSKVCKDNQSRGKLNPQARASKFVSYQELRVQEPTDQVPVGHVPRSVTILALGECVKQCVPGDMVTVHGIYLPQLILAQKTQKSRLVHDTYIEAFKIVKEKKSYKDTTIDHGVIAAIESQKAKTPDIYTTLAKSLAPEIYGKDDVKKSLLLLLVGGVSKEMPDGMKIRGNINVLLMGDPGVAKSQLLKYIAHISPRGVFTTGKGSSGVGLTAAIVKDPVTSKKNNFNIFSLIFLDDLTLEGGALVLADMGVCCIDEFDKMSDYDRANIHEVMEQQTVSIAKAGITTRLNARASVLAAANPLYGRYNKKLTPHQNINLPAALLSRFDLIHLLLDKPDLSGDEALAKHVVFVHQHHKHPELTFDPLDPKFVRAYIAEAKKVDPIIPR
jgi:DNA replication licensing factor MCM7